MIDETQAIKSEESKGVVVVVKPNEKMASFIRTDRKTDIGEQDCGSLTETREASRPQKGSK